jgi:TRAP-type C4-dicarboxylate transport system permease small subunit
MASPLAERLRKAAGAIAAFAMAVVFVLFVAGVGMRYLANRPQNWIDETVTLISVWATFFTAAFVLRWPEHIAFDVVYNLLRPSARRVALLVGAAGFIALIGAAMPGMVDYTLFLWRERTDALQLRLDYVYAIFPVFFLVLLVRLALTIRHLLGASWREELEHWQGGADETAP